MDALRLMPDVSLGTKTTMKSLSLVIASAILGFVSLPTPAAAQLSASSNAFKVTLLGTGSPALSVARFGPSTLVEVGGQRLLFDCGRAATLRIAQLGIPLASVSDVFLTHLHSDHLNGLSDLWLTGWIPGGGGRTAPLHVHGPSGTQEMMQHLTQAHVADIKMRIADQGLPQRGVDVVAADIVEGVVFERDGVRVTAFEVNHGEALKPAFGYRVDYQGHSAVISGDTQPSDNLVRMSKGADVLIHEVMAAKPEFLTASPAQQIIMAHHTNPAQAGLIFSEVKPRLAVFTHIILSGDAKVSAPTVPELIAETRKAYAGPLEAGEDLMQIDVVAATVVQRPK